MTRRGKTMNALFRILFNATVSSRGNLLGAFMTDTFKVSSETSAMQQHRDLIY
jgi:hypothetical protein